MADDKKTKEDAKAPAKKDESRKEAPAKKDEVKRQTPKKEAPAAAPKGEAKEVDPAPKAPSKEEEEKPKTAPKKLSAPKEAAPKRQAASVKPVRKPKPPRKPIPKGMDIGIDVELPKKECKDRFCPFHGTLPVRGQILEGIVVSDRMQQSVVVKREYMRLNKKYERLEKRSGKYLAHSPPCLGTKSGDRVRIMECRPLSKTISYVVIEKRTGE